jgi:hypothetical protein
MLNQISHQLKYLGSLLIVPLLALVIVTGLPTAAGAQDDDRQYAVEDLVPGDAYLGNEAAPYDAGMIDPGAITEPNPALETDMADPSAISVDSDGDGLVDLDEGRYGTDPATPDTDGDGLSDGAEFHQLGTFPWTADTEGDDLGDGDELLTYGTDPRNPDTDGDGFADGFEVGTVGSNPANADSDGDGMLDGEDPRPLR